MKIFWKNKAKQVEKDSENCHNPWAGLASYDDPEFAAQKLKFCGRDDDSYDVAKLIHNNIFITLYGKSGIGKTSLLNAGVFPELREKQYTPLSLRLGMRDEENPKSFQTMIVEIIEHTINSIDTINIVDKQTDEHAADYLWNYFARHRFFDKYGEPTTPVVVFDQFEEVFRSGHKETDTLLRQLDYINDKDHSLDNCILNDKTYRYETNFRFVISIREDDLYRLEDSIDNCYLPALKRCRYRLRNLSEQGARDAILIPGEGLFLPEEQEGIVNAIIEKSRNEDGRISTNILSLLCNRIFSDFQKSNTTHISQLLVDNFIKGNPFERFYYEATRGFSNKEKTYIEDHLVDSAGRRNSVPEADFLLYIKRGSTLLVGDTRILQRTSTSSDSGNYRIELIHDSFCAPLVEMKEKRAKRKRFLGIILFSLFSIAIVIAYLLYENHGIKKQNSNLEKENEIFEEVGKLEVKRDSVLNLLNTKSKSSKTESSKIISYIKVEKTGSGYSMNGIPYLYEQPTNGQIKSWAKSNDKKCAKKIEKQMKSYDVPSEMVDKDPCLVYLILNSKSIDKIEDKQNWFNLWEMMNDEQKDKLYDILYREAYNMAAIVYKYQDDPEKLNNLAYEYANAGKEKWEEAISTIDKAIELNPKEANYYVSKGEILLMMGDQQNALKMLEKVIELDPNFLNRHNDTTPFYQQLKAKSLIR